MVGCVVWCHMGRSNIWPALPLGPPPPVALSCDEIVLPAKPYWMQNHIVGKVVTVLLTVTVYLEARPFPAALGDGH
jgi:hypothetical protein